MKTRLCFLLAFWACFLAVVCLECGGRAFGAEDDLSHHPGGVVAQCFDGDTLKLADRRIVRLAGIDSPEMEHRNSRAQLYARQSRQELISLAKGRKVRLVAAGTACRDRHGRLVADVVLEDGQSLNRLMVERGAAFFYPHQDLWPQFQEDLKELQADAIKERRGLWKQLLSLPLAGEHYIGNRASLRFFPVNCAEAQSIKLRNRVHFGTLMDAFMAGYAPARVCVFWPTVK